MKNSNFNSPFVHLRHGRLTLHMFSMTKPCENPPEFSPYSSFSPDEWWWLIPDVCLPVNSPPQKTLCARLFNHLFIVCPSYFPLTFFGTKVIELLSKRGSYLLREFRRVGFTFVLQSLFICLYKQSLEYEIFIRNNLFHSILICFFSASPISYI